MAAFAVGMRGEAERVVTESLTAARLGSGSVPVLGTPALLAMMEDAAVSAVAPALAEGTTTVGVWVELEHLAPSHVGARVRATAVLSNVERRTLLFDCEAFDGETRIGRARHKRAVVNVERFLAHA